MTQSVIVYLVVLSVPKQFPIIPKFRIPCHQINILTFYTNMYLLFSFIITRKCCGDTPPYTCHRTNVVTECQLEQEEVQV